MRNKLIGIIAIFIGVFILYKVTRPGSEKIVFDKETDRYVALAFLISGAYVLFFRR